MKEMEDLAALALEGPHWSFALTLYGRPGVAEACLVLQDRAGVDINILLFALYAAVHRGVGVTGPELAEMDEAVAAWRREVVHPLRSIRRRLKAGPPPAPSTSTETLRSQVKAMELGAEQIEQAILMQWLGQRDRPGTYQAGELAALVDSVVSYFAGRNGAPSSHTAETRAAMEIVLEQAGHGNSRHVGS